MAWAHVFRKASVWFGGLEKLGNKPKRLAGRRSLRLESMEARDVPATFTFGDAGFESVAVSVGSFKYGPAGSAWAFSGAAGVSANGSGFTSGNPVAPQGGQVAFLQGTGTMSQAITLNAGTYVLSFTAAQRNNAPSAQTMQVLLDGKTIGAFNDVYGGTYQPQTSTSFTVAAGSHTITLQGTNLFGGDNTVFIDQVAITEQSIGFLDNGFEAPVQSPGAFAYAPTDAKWNFAGSAGITTNYSGFTSGNPSTVQGSQAAFLQSLGSMNQVVNLAAGTYAIDFAAAQRGNFVSGQTFQVLVDGVSVGGFNSLRSTAYVDMTTTSFKVTAGSHTITFKGTNLNGGDNTVFIDQVTITTQATGLMDSGFELPALANGAFKYNPAGPAWSFSGAAGVTTNGSGFTSGNPGAPQGSQVAFLQQAAAISQQVSFTAGTYAISFAAAQRGNTTSYQTFQVLFDGKAIGSFNNLNGANFVELTTSSFAATAGLHTITIQSNNLYGGDNTVLIDRVAISQQAVGLYDSGLEAPALSPSTFLYNPSGSSWTFSGSAGLASNGSGFTAGNPLAPQGSQVAFLQNLGSMSQSMNFAAGTYAVSFDAAQRANVGSYQTFQVLIDGKNVGSFTGVGSTAYTRQNSTTFSVPAGSHTVAFQATNLNGGDNTIFIDQINIEQLDNALVDSGFESATVPAGGFKYNPTGTAWTYTGSAGVTSNNSGFTSGNTNAPQGGQSAFLQQLSSMSQKVTFAAGTYYLGFNAAQRANYASNQTFQVLIDGNLVGSYDGFGTAYTNQYTIDFAVSAGDHTITFQGTNIHGGDNTVLIDQVTVFTAT